MKKFLDDPNFRLEAMASDNWEMYDKTKKELIDYEKFSNISCINISLDLQ